jgi:predicted AAA+ superfamily ATPase
MTELIERYWTPLLAKRLQESRPLIQIVLGPRQIGKTTSLSQLQAIWGDARVVSKSADDAQLDGRLWIEHAWDEARRIFHTAPQGGVLLLLDEIQKVDQWSETIKKNWDEDIRKKIFIRVVLSGSSSLSIQKGLSESLAGRFEIIAATHLSFAEFRELSQADVDHYIFFGGYPGAIQFMNDEQRWRQYVSQSIIESVLSRDILMMTRVDKPALLRRLFALAAGYSGQLLSYQKMIGQLQDAGNTTTLAHYLELLDQAFLIVGLKKYEGARARLRSSSPKLQTHNNALMSAQSMRSFSEVRSEPDIWGRFVESAVGSYLVNQSRVEGFDLGYWRDGNFEVDFVISYGKKVLGIEVKSGRRSKVSGLLAFSKKFPKAKTMIIERDSVEKFLLTSPILSLLD